MSSHGQPTVSATAEVRFAGTRRGFVGHVMASEPRRIVVAAPLRSGAGSAPRRPGARAELVWTDATHMLALPVELAAVQHAVLPLWHFRAVGPATSRQRRAAVRVPMHATVQLRGPVGQVTGVTVDVSEGGLQCVVDGRGPFVPQVGDQLSVTLLLPPDADPLVARATVLRSRARSEGRRTVGVGFVGLEDQEQDILRRRVFMELRSRLAAGLT